MEPIRGLECVANIPHQLGLRQNPGFIDSPAILACCFTDVLSMTHKRKGLTPDLKYPEPTDIKHKSWIVLPGIAMIRDYGKIRVHENKPRDIPRKLNARQDLENIGIPVKIQSANRRYICDGADFDVLTKELAET